MKNKIKTIGGLVALSVILATAASCKKEYLPDEATEHIIGVERHITTSASLPQSADKAYLDEPDGRKVKWELTDALNINGTNLPLASLNADATTAKFEGTAYAMTSGSNDIYWAVYPTTIVGAASGSTIPSNFTANSLTVNFPATQTYDASVNALSGNTLMAGYASVPSSTENIVFQMRNLGTVLKLNLTADASATNKHASRIEFTTTNGALAGDFTVNNNTTDPTVTATATATKTLTVNLTDGTNNYIDLSSAKDIYVILPPLASKNLTMRVYNTDGGKSSKTVSSTTLERNKIYTNTASDLCFCECGGGSPYFSVSAAGDKVVFAPGNLQWSATGGGTNPTTHTVAGGGTAPGTWRFAANQWDYVGDATAGNVYGVGGNSTVMCDNSQISQTYQGWIDLFGWATSGWDNTANDQYAINYQPWASSSSTVHSTYNPLGYGPSSNMTDSNLTGTSANYDWGVYNAIYNPKTNTTDPPGTWRTLTVHEWIYLFQTRITCSGVRYAKATVNNVQGLILVPDNWDVNTYALNGTNTNNAAFTLNTISSTDWTNIFEPAGCAFLPAAGYRNRGTPVSGLGSSNLGSYWSVTNNHSMIQTYRTRIDSDVVYANYTSYRFCGLSVRLAKDL